MSNKKIFKIILIIILIIAFIFLLNLGRKIYILSKYSNKCNEYSKITNFYRKTNAEEDATIELWRKDNLGFLKRTSKDDIKMIYYGEDYNWIIVDSPEGKNAVKMNKEGPGVESQTLTSGSLSLETFWNKVQVAFSSKITTEKLNNVECYKVYINKDFQIFINKTNFLITREINGSTDTGIIEYKINEVRNEDVLMPNLAGYTIKDTTNLDSH